MSDRKYGIGDGNPTTWHQIKERRAEIGRRVMGALYFIPAAGSIWRSLQFSLWRNRSEPMSMSAYLTLLVFVTICGMIVAALTVPRQVVAARIRNGRPVGFGWRLLLAWEGLPAVIWAIGIVLAIPIIMIFMLAAMGI